MKENVLAGFLRIVARAWRTNPTASAMIADGFASLIEKEIERERAASAETRRRERMYVARMRREAADAKVARKRGAK